MALLMILLRIIHIFSGVAWIGVAFTNITFLQPTFQATGAEGQKVMQHLTGRTRFLITGYTVATLTMLSGLIMLAILSDFRPEYFATPYGTFLTIGGLAGIVTWVIVVVIVRGIFNKMKALGMQIAAQGTPPTPEQGAEMAAYGARLGGLGRASLILLAVALFGMSVAQYAGSLF